MPLKGCYVLAFAAAAAAADLKTGRIPNLLIAAGAGGGLLLTLTGEGPACARMLSFLAGAALPLLPGFLLFGCRMMGAGDIKLLAVLGGMAGGGGSLRLLAGSLLCGGILSLSLILGVTGIRSRVRVLSAYAGEVREVLSARGRLRELPSYRRLSSSLDGSLGEFHFAVPVLMASVLYAGGVL